MGYLVLFGRSTLKSNLILISILAISLFSATPQVFSQEPLAGPFMLRDQFPIRALFLGLRPETGHLLPLKTSQWVVRSCYSNTYASTRPLGDPIVAGDYYKSAPLNEYRLFADTETLRVALDLDWRLISMLQIGLTLPFIRHSGGFLDGFVEDFHKLFKLTNGGREETPRNNHGVFVVRNGKFWIENTKAASFSLGDIVLRIKLPLYHHKDIFNISMSGALKLPTGNIDKLTGSGGIDVQAALFASLSPYKRLAVHYNLSHSWLGNPLQTKAFPVRSILTNLIAFEYLATNRLKAQVQINSNTGPFPDSRLGPLNRTAFEVSGGTKYGFSDNMTLELAIIENLSQYQNTPDIGIHVGILWRYP
tara:strand:- start:46781 stop:47869 length:1089 start_codon:yes stop_codon:yes gene_type:complete